jgi:hypothetical protein
MDVPVSVRLASNTQIPLAGVSYGPETGACGLILKPHDSEGVGREEVCSLLIGRLQDVSTHLSFIRCLVIRWL